MAIGSRRKSSLAVIFPLDGLIHYLYALPMPLMTAAAKETDAMFTPLHDHVTCTNEYTGGDFCCEAAELHALAHSVECEVCGSLAYGNAKDGFRCSNDDCEAQHEYDDANGAVCVGCGAVGDWARMPIGDHACPDCYATAKAESEASETN